MCIHFAKYGRLLTTMSTPRHHYNLRSLAKKEIVQETENKPTNHQPGRGFVINNKTIDIPQNVNFTYSFF